MGVRNIKGHIALDINRSKSLLNRGKNFVGDANQYNQQLQQQAGQPAQAGRGARGRSAEARAEPSVSVRPNADEQRGSRWPLTRRTRDGVSTEAQDTPSSPQWHDPTVRSACCGESGGALAPCLVEPPFNEEFHCSIIPPHLACVERIVNVVERTVRERTVVYGIV